MARRKRRHKRRFTAKARAACLRNLKKARAKRHKGHRRHRRGRRH